MSEKIRPMKPTGSDKSTLFALMELQVPVGEKQVWRSETYVTDYLHGYSVPASAVLVLDGTAAGAVTVELYAPAMLFNHSGFRTAQEIACLLGLPDLEITWRRDHATEHAMREHKTRGGVVVPSQGFQMSPNGR